MAYFILIKECLEFYYLCIILKEKWFTTKYSFGFFLILHFLSTLAVYVEINGENMLLSSNLKKNFFQLLLVKNWKDYNLSKFRINWLITRFFLNYFFLPRENSSLKKKGCCKTAFITNLLFNEPFCFQSRLWRSGLERCPRKWKVWCSNPSRNRPKS